MVCVTAGVFVAHAPATAMSRSAKAPSARLTSPVSRRTQRKGSFMRRSDKLVEDRAEPLAQCGIGRNDFGREAPGHNGESALKLLCIEPADERLRERTRHLRGESIQAAPLARG